MHITKLTLENFRGFEHLELEPGKLCLLVGRNGSGKSSVLRAIAAVFGDYVHTTLGYNDDLLGEWDLRAEADGGSVIVQKSSVTRSAICLAGEAWQMSSYGFEKEEGFCILLSTARSHGSGALSGLVPWFVEQENLENEIRLGEDPDHRNRSLQTIRQALGTFFAELPDADYSEPRISRRVSQPKGPISIDRTVGTLVFKKNGQTLALHQLSDGEQTLLLTVMELARLQFVAYPESADPLAEPGLLLIDEVALHLHPSWQRAALPALQATFPGLQIIATTHSPQVMASVPTDAIKIIEGFKVYGTGVPVQGRDSNSILEEVMDVPPRPHGTQELLNLVSDHIDNDRLPQARSALQALKVTLTEKDPEVVRLQTMLDFLAS